ncbi:MAG: pirin family protein [Burkholderiales bacterium]|nr:pirin family protein [Burkholderiales bacterium]
MPVEALVAPRAKDLGGGFLVRRLLPASARQAVGPFVFFDHFGPVTVRPADNFDVRPHPHIGLATVTYLFEGAMVHRDSLGAVQRIEPGAINWMTAGRGIVHSERRPEDLATREYALHGLQLWAALPRAFEEAEPAFAHTAADDLPQWQADGLTLRLLVGDWFDRRSPVATHVPTLYLDALAEEDAALALPTDAGQRALYVVEGDVAVDGQAIAPYTMAVLAHDAAGVRAQRGARFVVIGGAPLDGPRFIHWNYVSSSRERIERAKDDWRAQRTPKIPGETEWIPLPP